MIPLALVVAALSYGALCRGALHALYCHFVLRGPTTVGWGDKHRLASSRITWLDSLFELLWGEKHLLASMTTFFFKIKIKN
jgi:hypothetical protein